MTKRIKSKEQATKMRFLQKIEQVVIVDKVCSSEISFPLDKEPLVYLYTKISFTFLHENLPIKSKALVTAKLDLG